MIIFAGIVAALPDAVLHTLEFVRQRELSIFAALFMVVLAVMVVAAIIFMERGQRRIPVQYAKRVVGRRVYSGQSSHLPLKINTAGVIPPIFASSVLLFPASIAEHVQRAAGSRSAYRRRSRRDRSSTAWSTSRLIIFFCYFYTAVTFNPTDVSDNLKKFGGYIPGIRPGQRTAEYIDRILSRITLPGALYVAAICVLPTILISQLRVSPSTSAARHSSSSSAWRSTPSRRWRRT